MLKFVVRRLLKMVPIILGVILIALLLLELMPSDPAAVIAGEDANPERLAAIRQELDLDEPVWKRFGQYVGGVVQGDLGRSPLSNIPVWDRISSTLPVTLSLGFVSVGFAVVLGMAGGTLAALRRDRFADRAVVATASVLQAVPPFVVGLALVIFLAVNRSWFPATGYVPFADDPWQWLRHLILPGITLALTAAAELARQTRGALVDTLEQDYIRAARAKGVNEFWVIGKHAAKNAATPVVTVLGLQVGRLLGATVVVELIFGMPGFGMLAMNAVVTRDLVLIQGVILVSGIAVLLANLVVDISYGYFNPRTRT